MLINIQYLANRIERSSLWFFLKQGNCNFFLNIKEKFCTMFYELNGPAEYKTPSVRPALLFLLAVLYFTCFFPFFLPLNSQQLQSFFRLDTLKFAPGSIFRILQIGAIRFHKTSA